MQQIIGAHVELMLLREKFQIARNILRDVVDNERSVVDHLSAGTASEIDHAILDRLALRKALCAEIDDFLIFDEEMSGLSMGDYLLGETASPQEFLGTWEADDIGTQPSEGDRKP